MGARHELWLASIDTQTPKPEHLAAAREVCREVAVCVRGETGALARGALHLLLGDSLTEGYFADAGLSRTLREWCARTTFDGVLTYSSAMVPAAQLVPASRRVLDLGDVDSAKWESYARLSLPPLRWFYRAEARRVTALEVRGARQHDACLLVNERERQKFLRRSPGTIAGVVPTTVDLSEYDDAPATLPAGQVVGMVGSMFYPPNVRAVNWFGRHVWPHVRQALPQAEWWIVGSRPAPAVQRWAAEPGVTVTGRVDDVRPYLYKLRVFANPVHGDLGIQSKLIVAMAAGRAAVVTPDVAAGIDYDDPPPFVIAASPNSFAEAVVRLLRDDAAAAAMARRARILAAAQYGMDEQVRRLEQWLCGPAASEPRARGRRGLAAVAAAPVGKRGTR